MSESENQEFTLKEGTNDYVEDGKNKLVVKCKFCGSKILDMKCGKYIVQEVSITFISLNRHIAYFTHKYNLNSSHKSDTNLDRSFCRN